MDKDKNRPNKKEIMKLIEQLCSFEHRRTGTENNYKAARIIQEHFKDYGLEDAKIEQFYTDLYFPRTWELKINGMDVPCYFINYTNFSGKRGVTDTGYLEAELVYLGDGKEEDYNRVDVAGKIVMADVKWLDCTLRFFEENHAAGKTFWYDPEKTLGMDDYIYKNTYDPNTWPWNYYYAKQRGAIGFIGVLCDNCDHYIHYCENYSGEWELLGITEEEAVMTIPGLWVNVSTAEQIKETLAKGKVLAEMRMASEISAGNTNVVSGILPGQSEETILIHSHLDSCYRGAVQDATGMSVVLAIAKYYAKIPKEDRKKTLMFAATDGHFSGYGGHKGFLDNRKKEGRNIIVDFAIEHIAMEAIDDRDNKEDQMVFTGEISMRLLYVTQNENLLRIAKEAVINNNLVKSQILPVVKGVGDVCTDAYRFWLNDIPVVSYLSPVIYLMDEQDTLDKVAVDQLEPVANAYIEMIEQASNMDAEDMKEKEELKYF